MNAKHLLLCLTLMVSILLGGCRNGKTKNIPVDSSAKPKWQNELKSMLPYLGDRNWILIVDKAFPEQTAKGIKMIYTHEKLLPVLRYTLNLIHSANHVGAVIYTDKELHYLTSDEVPDINQYRDSLKKIFGKQNIHSILHEQVFNQMNNDSKLFQVVVLKTNETIPYSSVYLHLNCAYWNDSLETKLRKDMSR